MQWAGVGMWMVLGLSACSPTKTEIGNLNVIPQPQEVSQDIQAHPFVINPQTGIVYPEGNEKLQRTAEFLASYIKEATGITVRTTTEAARKNSIILAVDGSITNKEGYQLEVTSENIHLNVSIRPRACFFPLFSFLPLWLHYNLNPLCVQY